MQPTDKAPAFRKESFYCPHCSCFAHQQWDEARVDVGNFGESQFTQSQPVWIAHCVQCNKESIWLAPELSDLLIAGLSDSLAPGLSASTGGRMLYPDSTPISLPPEASQKVRKIHDEAAAIVSKSPRAAAALLRLAIETLCKELLPEEGKKRSLKDMIEQISEKEHFGDLLRKAMHSVRLIGNKAIHPGLISEDDSTDPRPLFWLVGYIIDQTMSRHQKAQKIIQMAEKTEQSVEASGDLDKQES